MTRKGSTSSGWLSLMIAIFINAILVGVLFMAVSALLPSSILPCTYPLAQSLGLAVSAVLILQLFAGAKISPRPRKALPIIDITLILLSLWLGSYALSPLGFSNGRIPILRGFLVTTASRGGLYIASGDIISLGSSSTAAISPILLSSDVRCNWSSANGAALDDPQSCDTFYIPPMEEYDLLKVSIRPGCGLPNSIGQIKISILP